jgi:predicted alpha/beta hydrolase family esterase
MAAYARVLEKDAHPIMQKQVVVIHGGDTFDTYEEYLLFLKSFEVDLEYFKSTKGWKDTLDQALGSAYEIIRPRMPNATNAKYAEWKIWFEKLTPFLVDGVILIGHSLGGIFLAKYLAENTFPKKIKAVFLVAAPYDANDSDYSLADFTLPVSLSKVTEQGGVVTLYHSSDDPVVPFVDLEKYKKALPEAETVVFADRQHFNQETFPELVTAIKDLK